MKDLPHHIKKYNRQVIRSSHREDMDEELWKEEFAKEKSPRQKKKQAKQRAAKAKNNTPPHPLDIEEKNRMMKHRTPIKQPQSRKTPPAK